jgi:hypothetical protein
VRMARKYRVPVSWYIKIAEKFGFSEK